MIVIVPVIVRDNADMDEVSYCNSYFTNGYFVCVHILHCSIESKRKLEQLERTEPKQVKDLLFLFYLLTRSSIQKIILPLKADLAMPGVIFGHHNCGKEQRKRVRQLKVEAKMLLRILQLTEKHP